MSSNSNSQSVPPVDESVDNIDQSVDQKVNKKQDDDQHNEKKSNAPIRQGKVNDFVRVTRSTQVATATSSDILSHLKDAAVVVPPLPYEGIDTIPTSYSELDALVEALHLFFHASPSFDCLPDNDDRTSFHGVMYCEDLSFLTFGARIYRDVSDKLHLEVNRIHGCGVRFAQFYAAIGSEFSAIELDICTFEPPAFMFDDENDGDYDDIPLFTTNCVTCVDGVDVILPHDHEADDEDIITSGHSNSNDKTITACPIMSNLQWSLDVLATDSISDRGAIILQAFDTLSTTLDSSIAIEHAELATMLTPLMQSLPTFLMSDSKFCLKALTFLSKLAQVPSAASSIAQYVTPELLYNTLVLHNYADHEGQRKETSHILDVIMFREMSRLTFVVASASLRHAHVHITAEQRDAYQGFAEAIRSSNQNTARDALVYGSF